MTRGFLHSRTESAEEKEPEEKKELREIGHLAVWSVSTAKAGNGVDCLRDERLDTYWQSDGVQPHFVNIQFHRRVDIVELHLILDFKADESYTPSKFSIRAGTAIHDLREIHVVDLVEPNGCIKIPLCHDNGATEDRCVQPRPIRAFFVQVAVIANHQNGRDTHVRGIRVFGPLSDPLDALGLPCSIHTPDMAMYATLR